MQASAIDRSDQLERFYSAGDEEAGHLLERLLEDEVRPLLSKVLRRKLKPLSAAQSGRNADIEDLVQDGILRIAQELLAGRRGEGRINTLSGYTARVAEYAGDEYFRRKFRKRYNAIKRVTVNLRHHDAFYEWRFVSDESHGALSVWPPPPPKSPDSRSAAIRTNLHSTAKSILASDPADVGAGSPSSARCMHASLLWAAGALSVGDLALVLQAARNEFDEPDVGLNPEIATAPIAVAEQDETLFLSSIWDAVKQLRPRLARALLLNLRVKGENAVEVFEEFQISTRQEIAEILGLQPSELCDLPWPDRRIASYLGCTEEQVSGLRSSARRSICSRLSSSNRFPEECLRFRL